MSVGVMEIIGAIKKVYDLYNSGRKLFGEEGPGAQDIVDTVNERMDELIDIVEFNEIRDGLTKTKNTGDCLIEYQDKPTTDNLRDLKKTSRECLNDLQLLIDMGSVREAFWVAEAYNMVAPIRATALKLDERPEELITSLVWNRAIETNQVLLGRYFYDELPNIPLYFPDGLNYKKRGKLLQYALNNPTEVGWEAYRDVTEIVWQANEEVRKQTISGYPDHWFLIGHTQEIDNPESEHRYLQVPPDAEIGVRVSELPMPVDPSFLWSFEFESYDKVRIVHWRGKCLTARARGEELPPVYLRDYFDGDRQRWRIHPRYANGHVEIENHRYCPGCRIVLSCTDDNADVSLQTYPGRPVGRPWWLVRPPDDLRRPQVNISHSPWAITTNDRVTFSATASDNTGISRISIQVDGDEVATSRSSPCVHVDGPFPRGTVTCSASAYDVRGNTAWTSHDLVVLDEFESVPKLEAYQLPNQVYLSWKHFWKWEAGYLLEYKKSANAAFGEAWELLKNLPPKMTSYQLIEPEVGFSYLFRVAVLDPDGAPHYSNEVMITVSEDGSWPLELVYPNGGERLIGLAKHQISWKSSPQGPPRVTIQLSVDGGASWFLEAEDRNLENTGEHLVQMPNTSSSNCLLKIQDADKGIPFDLSTKPFSITPVNPDWLYDFRAFDRRPIIEELGELGRSLVYEIYFPPYSAQMAPGSQGALKAIESVLHDNPKLELIIEVHTDNVGNHDFNMQLSTTRAEAIKQWLVDQGGISSDRLVAVGCGMTRPIADNQYDAGRVLNTRVELIDKRSL